MEMKTLVITQHAALIALLRERHPQLVPDGTEIIAHVTDPEVLDGAHVIGVLPMHLAVRCARVTILPLELSEADRDASKRGDLTLDRLRSIAGAPVSYVVRRSAVVAAALSVIAEIAHDGLDEESDRGLVIAAKSMIVDGMPPQAAIDDAISFFDDDGPGGCPPEVRAALHETFGSIGE